MMIPFVDLGILDRKGCKQFFELLCHKVLKWNWYRVMGLDIIELEIPKRFEVDHVRE